MRGLRFGMPDEGLGYSGTLKRFELSFKESKIVVFCDLDSCGGADKELEKTYIQLEEYLRNNPFYQSTYDPVEVDDKAPGIVKVMAESSRKASVGPMATVAGAFSEHLMNFLLDSGATEAIVENGGDIALNVKNEVTVGLYAGSSPYSGKIALKIKSDNTPLGVCTSSASVGHSVSLGEADSVTVISDTMITPVIPLISWACFRAFFTGLSPLTWLAIAVAAPSASGVESEMTVTESASPRETE